MNLSNLAKKTSFQITKIRQKLKTSKDLQAILLLVFWTFGSRILGFVRSFLVLRMPTIDSEIFNSSFVLSEAITSFFILGSITVAILPQMIKLQESQKTELNEEFINLDSESGDNLDKVLEKKLKEKLNPDNFESQKNREFNRENFEKESKSQNIETSKKVKTAAIIQEDLATGNLENFILYPNSNQKNTIGKKNFDNKNNSYENWQNNLKSDQNDNTKQKNGNQNPTQNFEGGNFAQPISHFDSNLNQKNNHKIIQNTEKRFILPELSSDPLEINKFGETPKIVETIDNSQQKIDKNKFHKIFSNLKFNKDKLPQKNQNLDTNFDKNSKKIDKLSIYTNWCLLILGCFILILSLLGIIFIEPILSTFNPSFFAKVQESGKLGQMILLNQLLLFGPFLFAIKTILGVFLNIKKDYKIYSLEGVLANFGWIVALSILYPVFGLIGSGFGMFIGFGITILLFGLQARGLGLSFKLENFTGLDKLLWQTFALYWPRLLIFSNTRLAEIIVAATSGNPNDPQITSVAMALNFQGIFIGVVLAIGTVFLPNLTEILVQNGKSKQFWKMLFDYLKINFFLSILGTIATIIGVPILLFLLSKLPFISSRSILSDPIAINLIITLTIVSSFSLVFQSIGEVLNRYFIAVQRRWEPVIISVGGNFLAIQIALFFSKTWGSGRAAIGGFVLNTALFCFLSLYFVFQDWQSSKIDKPQD